jgi:hypothetical protein
MLFWLCSSVGAQQTKKVLQIGLLASGRPFPAPPPVEAFRQGLRELGYIEGQNILVEYRWAEGKNERYAILAYDLVSLGVMSSWFRERKPLLLPSTQPAQLLLLSAAPAISSVRASLPVWRDQEETLRALLHRP